MEGENYRHHKKSIKKASSNEIMENQPTNEINKVSGARSSSFLDEHVKHQILFIKHIQL